MPTEDSGRVPPFGDRWNVKWDAASALLMFRNRLLHLVVKCFSPIVDARIVNEYAFLCGLEAPYATGELEASFADALIAGEGIRATLIYQTMANANTAADIAFYLENVVKAVNTATSAAHRGTLAAARTGFFSDLRALVTANPGVGLELTLRDTEIVTYPAGAKMLDTGLVNENLDWLRDYPEAGTAMERALALYLSGDRRQVRDLVDNLRVALEAVLRGVLHNRRSLENQSVELKSWLKAQGVHEQIRNLFSSLLFGPYSVFQNDVAKHGKGVLLGPEIEFAIYQTGVFLRLILQLAKRAQRAKSP